MDIDTGNNQLVNNIFLDEEIWHAIEQCKHDFLEFGINPEEAIYMKPQVASSWVRSYNLGVDPAKTKLYTSISNGEYNKIIEKNSLITEIAQPLIWMIEDLRLSSDYVLELIEPSGVTLAFAGKLDIHSFVKKKSIFSEKTMGTNAHSLCMLYKAPFQLLGPEHYCYSLHGLAASAAPILDENGMLLASLLLTQPLPDAPWTKQFHKLLAHTMRFIATLAAAIEHRLKVYKIKSAEIPSKKINNMLNAVIASAGENIITVDKDGQIMQISPEAAKIMDIPPELAVNQRLEELCGMHWPGGLLDSLNIDDKMTVRIKSQPYALNVNLITDRDTHEIDGAIVRLDQQEQKKKNIAKAIKVGDFANITFQDILGTGKAINDTKKLAMQFAASNENVLLIGESGTGKEYFAQAIHNQSRPGGSFMSVNCAAIPPRLIESELFGYEGGSFTGAERNGRPGKIELTDGGTLFLDEIGDMPLELQAVLLRVLENKRVIRLGGKCYKQVDFRLITATNKNLTKMVEDGTFRKDLYYRLSILTINLPPLRDRGDDKVFFAERFLEECANKNNYMHKNKEPKPKFSPDTIKLINSYPWPGNLRQLKNAVYSAYYSASSHIITPGDLPVSVSIDESIVKNFVYETLGAGDGRVPEVLSLRKLEESAIRLALHHTHNSVAKAAEMLEISKATLYRKLKIYDLPGH